MRALKRDSRVAHRSGDKRIVGIVRRVIAEVHLDGDFGPHPVAYDVDKLDVLDGDFELSLNESDRQLTLLALAVLSLKSPGLDYALNEIAMRIDNVTGGRAQMFDAFREARADQFQLPGLICGRCGRQRSDHKAEPGEPGRDHECAGFSAALLRAT
jgi:hypothetical protein